LADLLGVFAFDFLGTIGVIDVMLSLSSILSDLDDSKTLESGNISAN